MRKRVEQLLGGRGLAVALGTFHSTCVRILRKWHAELGFRQSFVIYDDADQLGLIRDCLKGLNLSERAMSPRAVAARISRAKNEMLTPGEYAAAATDFTEERTAKIYSMYQERLRASHAVDFDDLLMLTVLLFRDHAAGPGVLPEPLPVRPGGRVPGHQPRPVPHHPRPGREARQPLRGGGRRPVHLPLARGRHPQHPRLRARLPGRRVIKLEQNYRSTQVHPGRRLRRWWRTTGAGRERRSGPRTRKGTPIVLYRAADEQDEAPSSRGDADLPSGGRGPLETSRSCTAPTPSPGVLEEALAAAPSPT